MRLSDFRVLTFDCYGTLIDWETGLLAALAPLADRLPESDRSPERLLEAFGRHEAEQQALTPALPYSSLLSVVHGRLAREWRLPQDDAQARRFGASIADWPAFDDTPGALRYLKRHFRLVILSNVDRASFAGSNRRLEVEFDAIHTAQDIGSYKPDPRNFAYLLEHVAKDFGAGPRDVLHVAQSLFHDHVPANACGIASAWIDRRRPTGGWGATPAPAVRPRVDFTFPTLEALAQAHRAEQVR